MTLEMTKYQKSIDSYIESKTTFKDLSADDIILLVIEYLDEAHDNLAIQISAHQLLAFFKAYVKDDKDEMGEAIRLFKKCFINDAMRFIHYIKTDLYLLSERRLNKQKKEQTKC